MRVYQKAIEMNRKLASVAPAIGRCDRDLLLQLRRASISVPLDVAEPLGHFSCARSFLVATCT
jgi:hypothetical protein